MKTFWTVIQYLLGLIGAYYAWFYINSVQPRPIDVVPIEVREKISSSLKNSPSCNKVTFDGKKLKPCGFNIFVDNEYNYYIGDKKVLSHYANPNLEFRGVEYISKDTIILSKSFTMYSSFWRYMLLPSYFELEVRKTSDLSLQESFRVLNYGNGFVFHNSAIYSLCETPQGKFCVIELNGTYQ